MSTLNSDRDLVEPRPGTPDGRSGLGVTKADSRTKLLKGTLAGVGALFVMSLGIWVTETWPGQGWLAFPFLLVMFLLVRVSWTQLRLVREETKAVAVADASGAPHIGESSAQQRSDSPSEVVATVDAPSGDRHRAKRLAWWGLGLFIGGQILFFLFVGVATAIGGPDALENPDPLPKAAIIVVSLAWMLMSFIGLICGAMAVIQAIIDRRTSSAAARGQLWLATEDEAAALVAAVRQSAAESSARYSRYGGVSTEMAAHLPNDVWQIDLTLLTDLATAGEIGRHALDSAQATIIGDWRSGTETVIRGWWKVTYPAVVTLRFRPADQGTTYVVIRAVAKQGGINRRVAQRAAEQVAAALGPSVPTSRGTGMVQAAG